ncbi:rhomboid family intramembrane serine protease [Ferruginibacter sp.]|nr:rhomboid family intramembrane serine protease [Ferruginibacter sp.]
MPRQEQTIALTNLDKETALAISYQALKNLKWDILFAGEEKLLGQTIKKWNSNPQHVLITYNGSELSVSSEMIKDELLDITGKNKKNIAAFFAAFEVAKNNISTDAIEANKDAITELRSVTVAAAEQEQRDVEEIDKAMNLSGSNMYVTYGIIAINVLLFILMVVNGAGLFEPNGYVHIKWGSDYAPLTLSGDWWRLVTNVFIHFGIIHLAMNMYCLYTVGVYLEPMLGKAKYTAAYLCTGVLASIVSLWWHNDPVNSAGASGAVFGMYGLFLALLTTSLIPKQMRQPLLQSIVIFVAYNLFYGLKGGVDNAAHIGGLLSGFVIGYIYVYAVKKEKQEQKLQWIVPAVVILTLIIAFSYLQQNKVGDEVRTAGLNAGYKDNDKYNNSLNEIVTIEDKAVAPLSDTTLTDPELKNKIENTCFPLWKQAEDKLKQMQAYEVSAGVQKKTTKLLEYIQLRRKELDVFNKMIETQDQEALIPALNEIRDSISVIGAAIQKL